MYSALAVLTWETRIYFTLPNARNNRTIIQLKQIKGANECKTKRVKHCGVTS
jgi:hypothetical protein